MTKKSEVLSPSIAKLILSVRGHRVMLDADLAQLYGVATANLNKAVKRNIDRFPADFVFRLTVEEASALRFQSGISKVAGRGGRRYLPFVFTEQGVAMLSSVLRSRRAVEVNIEIMRAFVQLRRFMSAHREMAQKLAQLERKIGAHDEQIQAIFNAIRQLMAPPEAKKRKLGFLVEEKAAAYGRK
ncbi:MAG TPA: ORF6N domain-containing protein [Candidatus Binatia bacterium]